MQAPEGLPELSQEIKDRLQPHIEDQANHYRTNVTPEQVQFSNAQMHRMQSDPSHLQNQKEEVNKLFSDHDVNQDGLHDVNEYIAFSAAMVERQRVQGGFVDEREGRNEWYAEIYAITNDVTPGVDGITVSDWRAVIYYWMGKAATLMAPQDGGEGGAAQQ